MEDSYEARALFLIMWSGAPSVQLKAMFPEWAAKRDKMKIGSVDEVLWVTEFCRKALEMKATA